MENNTSSENIKKQHKESFLTDLEILNKFKKSVEPQEDLSEKVELDFKFRDEDVLNKLDKKTKSKKDNLLSNEDEKSHQDSE